MARLVTKATLRLRARREADMEFSQLADDEEVDQYINDSAAEFYDLVLAQDPDYFLNPTPFSITLTSGVDTYALPADFYKLRGVDTQLSAVANQWITLEPFNFKQRNLYNWAPVNWNILGVANVKYHLMGPTGGVAQIKFIPGPLSPQTIRLWYVPACPTLVAETDSLDGVNGWDEYVVVDTAIKLLQKEESDTALLMARKAALMERIAAMAPSRDSGTAPVTVDKFSANSFPFPDDGF